MRSARDLRTLDSRSGEVDELADKRVKRRAPNRFFTASVDFGEKMDTFGGREGMPPGGC